MWVFRGADNSLYYFWEKQSYTVGRKSTDIIINNDESISRNHAQLEIDSQNIFLTDKGSKYGTSVNGTKLKSNERLKLKHNDQIKFGLLNNQQSKFKLEKLAFTVVTSNINSSDKKVLQKALDFLKANRANSAWSKTCTHLVVSEVILTAKVLCALTEEQPIVTAKYFEDYIKSIKNNEPPPDVNEYLPEITESLLCKKIKLKYDPSRRTLFKNKIFVFLTEKSKQLMAELITVTGGEAVSWEQKRISLDTLKTDPLRYLFLEENVDAVNQHTGLYKSFSKCVKFLSDNSMRSIPLQEIALAIVHNSCEENCNPMFNRIGLLIANTPSTQNSEEILAFATQQISATSTQKESQMSEGTIVVMPSYDHGTELSVIEKNDSGKRLLDLDTSEEMPSKKKKEDTPAPPAKSKNVNKVLSNENVEDHSTISNLFSFNRSNSSSQSTNTSKAGGLFDFPDSKSASSKSTSNVSKSGLFASKSASSKSTNVSKPGMFDFPVLMNPNAPKPKPVEKKIDEDNPFIQKPVKEKKIEEENPFMQKPVEEKKNEENNPFMRKPVEENIVEENPFIRKRKATKDIAPVPKKIPLENISNKLIQKQNPSNTNSVNGSIKSELSTIIKSNTWLSKSIKKEIKEDVTVKTENDVTVKTEDDVDAELSRLNEQFKNSILIEFMPLTVKKEQEISINDKEQTKPSRINYKKFHKNHVAKYQTVIITNDQMAHFVIGENICYNLSDDEMEADELKVPTAPKQGRFQFNCD